MKKLLFIAGLILATQSFGENTSTLPNIILILADDMGYGDLACQNPDSKLATPHLDRLRSEGMLFTDAHSASGVCSPSRYSLLTGRYHWRGKLKRGIVGNMEDEGVIEKDRLTLSAMLREKGYATAMVGKWHLGFDWKAVRKPNAKPELISKGKRKKKVWAADDFDWTKRIPGGPVDCGFDYYFGDDVINFAPYFWFKNDRASVIPTEPFSPSIEPLEGYVECRPGPMVKGWKLEEVLPTLTKQAVSWVRARKDKPQPFFLYFSLPSPHAPIIPNKEFQGKSEAGYYGDFVQQTDWCVGQVLSAMKASGFAENTLVIFSSDNGPEKYAYPRIQKFQHDSSGGLRGLKRDLFEGGHHVPFIATWPEKIQANSTCTETIGSIDVMATLAKILDYKLPENAAKDSVNITPLLYTEKYKTPFRKHLVHHAPNGSFALRSGDWLLIERKSGYISKCPDWYNQERGYAKDATPALLYNLKNDLTQHHNLYDKKPEIVTRLSQLLADIKNK